MEIIQITAFHRHHRFVERKPMLHAVTEQLETGIGVFCVSLHDVAVFPAADFLHRHRHIKVEQIDKRLYALRQHFVDHLVIKRDRFLIHFTTPVGDQTRPGNRGAEGVVIELFQQRDIFAPVFVKRRGILRTDVIVKARRLL